MELSDVQKQQVARWLNEGAKLSEVQQRLETEFGLRLTYMEVKLLVGDLQLMPKDAEPPSPPSPSPASGGVGGEGRPPTIGAPLSGEVLPPRPKGSVSVSVDQLTKPGAVASGSVTFRDGKAAAWYLDQMGRLGLAPKEKGYRPAPVDMEDFQIALERELARFGY